MNNDVNRRKRVNRIKAAIILIIIFMLVLPTILCILLGLQVNRLQKQVDQLAAARGITETAEVKKGDNYVYAAVKAPNILGTYITPTVVPITPEAKNNTGVSEAKQENDTNESVLSDSTNQVNDNKINEDNNKKDDKKSSGIYAGKKVYLTFDDGPSIYTGQILDILAKYKVKATFFAIGKEDEKSKEMYKRIVAEGHTLGMHSYSHDYQIVYKSVEDFEKDFTKLWKLLYDTTGYKPSVYRFPGGSENLAKMNGEDKVIKYLNKKSIVYFDWNVVNGDATNIDYTKKQLIHNVLDGVAQKDRSIVLMHDTQMKKSTVDSLPELIEALQAGGAQILPLNQDVTPIQMIRADSIKN